MTVASVLVVLGGLTAALGSLVQPGDVRHASALDLWVVRWGVELLGARVAFETDDGTVGRLSLSEAPA